MPDLWPDEFGSLDVTPPIVILKEQAELITKKTKGDVVGQVATGKNPSGLYHDFFLVAPFLDNYTYRLFAVVHPISLYPLEIVADVLDKRIRCQSPEEFEKQLKEILYSPQTKKVISSILAQTTAV